MSDIKKTPLYGEHIKLQSKIVEFAGWYMPVQYLGVREEHVNVRTNVGIFDVSHMGEIRIKGKNALPTIEWLTTNHVGKLENGEAQYTLLPNNQGGIVDDLIVYCLEKDNDYLLCVNAANTSKDWDWIQKNNKNADITNESHNWAQIAVQGPKAMVLLDALLPQIKPSDLPFFGFKTTKFANFNCLVARTGYTGEDGAEIFITPDGAVTLWQSLLKEGKQFGVQPIGLGARDTLRTEMDYSLYGHEIDDTTNPYHANLGWVVKPKIKDFIGKKIIIETKDTSPFKRVVFKMLDKGIPRQSYPLFSVDNKEIGKVTSGTLSPTLNEPVGIAYIKKEYSEIGTQFLVGIRQKKMTAQIVKSPLVKKENCK